MRAIPEPRTWEESLEAYRSQAQKLPPGEKKEQALAKVRSLERAIELRDSFARNIRIHREDQDGDEQTEGQRPKRRRAKPHTAQD